MVMLENISQSNYKNFRSIGNLSIFGRKPSSKDHQIKNK
jgi:hypothetical protein